MPVLQVIVASTRPGRVGRSVADWFVKEAGEHAGFEVRVADLAEIDLPLLDEPNHPSAREYQHQHTKDWSATIDAADAIVLVMPEYNYSFNAALKNAIDYLFFEWQYKPVAFVSYGNTSAGLRAVQMLKQVVTTLKMFPLNEAVAIQFVGQYVNDQGDFDGNEAMAAAAATMLDELVVISEALAPVRALQKAAES